MIVPGIRLISLNKKYMTASKTILLRLYFIAMTAIVVSCNAGVKSLVTYCPVKNGITEQAIALADTVVSGVVKDVSGKPIANAKVSSNIAGVFFTDNSGKFSVNLPKGLIVPQNFIFTYDTLAQEVRSYHPVMASTEYNIVLAPKKCCLRDLWIDIANRTPQAVEFPSLNYKTGSVTLSTDAKTKLKDAADALRNDPNFKLTITAYPSQYGDPKERISDKRLQIIADHLSEKLGISSDRIATEKKPGEGNGNAINVKAEKN